MATPTKTSSGLSKEALVMRVFKIQTFFQEKKLPRYVDIFRSVNSNISTDEVRAIWNLRVNANNVKTLEEMERIVEQLKAA